MVAMLSLIDLAEHIAESLDGAVTSHAMEKDEMVLIAKREEIVRVLQF